MSSAFYLTKQEFLAYCLVMEFLYSLGMKNFVSLFMVLAFVLATSFPSLSHAANIEQAQASESVDCHKQANATQNDKSSKKCCDKGVCKHSCHSGLSKIFNNDNGSFFPIASNVDGFTFTNDMAESSLSTRLKRPPKA